MDDKQLLEENFISFDYTKPEENEKRKEQLSLKHNKFLSNTNSKSVNSTGRRKVQITNAVHEKRSNHTFILHYN